MTGLGVPLDVRMDNLCTALAHLEAKVTYDSLRIDELNKELTAAKQIVRYLLQARRQHMEWFNHFGNNGGPVDIRSQHYWYETEQIHHIFCFVNVQDNWRDAWGGHESEESDSDAPAIAWTRPDDAAAEPREEMSCSLSHVADEAALAAMRGEEAERDDDAEQREETTLSLSCVADAAARAATRGEEAERNDDAEQREETSLSLSGVADAAARAAIVSLLDAIPETDSELAPTRHLGRRARSRSRMRLKASTSGSSAYGHHGQHEGHGHRSTRDADKVCYLKYSASNSGQPAADHVKQKGRGNGVLPRTTRHQAVGNLPHHHTRATRLISATVAGLARYSDMRQRLAPGLSVCTSSAGRICVCISDLWRCWGSQKNFTEDAIRSALQLHRLDDHGLVRHDVRGDILLIRPKGYRCTAQSCRGGCHPHTENESMDSDMD